MEREWFDDVVDEWLRYQASLVGRLRTMLFWRGVQGHLPTQACDVLDLGGGSGELAEVMAKAGHRVTLLDSAQPMLDAAKVRMPALNCVLADIETNDRTSLLAQSFDLITCHSVIEFVEHPEMVLKQCRTWLRHGGVLSLGFGNLNIRASSLNPPLDDLKILFCRPNFLLGRRHGIILTCETLIET